MARKFRLFAERPPDPILIGYRPPTRRERIGNMVVGIISIFIGAILLAAIVLPQFGIDLFQ